MGLTAIGADVLHSDAAGNTGSVSCLPCIQGSCLIPICWYNLSNQRDGITPHFLLYYYPVSCLWCTTNAKLLSYCLIPEIDSQELRATMTSGKVKLSLCLIKHYAMKAYGEVDVEFQIFLTSVLAGSEWYVKTRSPVELYRCFERTYCLQLLEREVNDARNQARSRYTRRHVPEANTLRPQ
jgi:hypothetical protein